MQNGINLFKTAKASLLVVVFLYLGACSYCSYGPALEHIRSLPVERIKKLYAQVASIVQHSKNNEFLNVLAEKQEHPELSDIQFKSLFNNGTNVIMILGGCVDNKAILRFDGILNNREQMVHLSWGEGPYYHEEILWHEGKAPNN